MSSINNTSLPVPTKKSENNECCIYEEALQRLTKEINKKMVEGANKTESNSSSSCIYRVPKEIRKLKESAYTPRFISIGPLHSEDEHILNSPVQDVKRSYTNSLFGRISPKGDESNVLIECVAKMRESLDKAKKCYAEEVEDVLDVEMLLIDGCFILELLYRFLHEEKNKRNDAIFNNILMPTYVRHDLLLLENQLPFFVLNELFNLTVAHIPGTFPIVEYVFSYFRGLWNSEKNGTPQPQENSQYDHILHILHNHYRDHDAVSIPRHGDPSLVIMPCASDLEYAGVKFKDSKKIKFHKPRGPFHRAHFELPTLNLDDSTESFLRNLIAFEQCCHGVPCYFTGYAFLMDTLINNTTDVQVLEKAKIIHNYLGASEDASNLFNNLCKEIVLGEIYFTDTTTAAAEYSKRCWHDAMAHLRRRYFSTPWTFLAFCAGFITFGISIIKFVRANFR
ncbi:UPF0481 protein At3g47200-like isoform X1 [Camellia sinensis]|uniref:Uncharacterized protein n=1 Tax=Camellia sinensis var. sinensis TaxID=542762 RepID=A0A4S4DHU4_CAMSN|nr:UPF0481 protein At3g47200-like isoform X1 [Camellia sinensis]THG01954.1 hypothetical protein TEA_027891 [Camellia sinensis var. sinensis]